MRITRQEGEKWLERISEEYPIEIANSIEQSVIETDNSVPQVKRLIDNPFLEIKVEDLTSNQAVHKYASDKEKVALLNFASYTNPGGSWSKGNDTIHIAQEESICLESSLFPVLNNKKFKSEYEYNRENKNISLYRNWAIYSPDIVFPTNPFGEKFCDILTCAAPNCNTPKSSSRKFMMEYSNTIYSRCRFILNILSKHKVDIPILGAFGCGVFKNDPATVAYIFEELLDRYDYGFKKVIFAIPKGENHDIFVKILLPQTEKC